MVEFERMCGKPQLAILLATGIASHEELTKEDFTNFFLEVVPHQIGQELTLRLVSHLCREETPVPATELMPCTEFCDEVVRIFRLLDVSFPPDQLSLDELKALWDP